MISHIRKWLKSMPKRPKILLEPFCGGAIVSLTAVTENLAEEVQMADIDENIAAFWKAALNHKRELTKCLSKFELTTDSISKIEEKTGGSTIEKGFRTLVLNRTRRGGIIAPGAAPIRRGENGKGIASRWYPETLAKRLDNITEISNQIKFVETDGLDLLEEHAETPGLAVFADPPYTAKGGKQAGKRLYSHNDIDHARLFKVLANSKADFLMTYDASEEIVNLIAKHNFHAVQVKMKTTHHAHNIELIITRRKLFSL